MFLTFPYKPDGGDSRDVAPSNPATTPPNKSPQHWPSNPLLPLSIPLIRKTLDSRRLDRRPGNPCGRGPRRRRRTEEGEDAGQVTHAFRPRRRPILPSWSTSRWSVDLATPGHDFTMAPPDARVKPPLECERDDVRWSLALVWRLRPRHPHGGAAAAPDWTGRRCPGSVLP